MPQYEALVHVFWELPFALRLPPHAFYCWEPVEGVALFDPKPEVGEFVWRRNSRFLQAADVFEDVGSPNQCYPTHDYFMTSEISSGRKIKTALLTRGPEGGFSEARPFTIANVFLCLRRKSEYADSTIIQRAGVALNNIVDIYRFVTMDPLVRSVRADLDCYYTLVSVADLPEDRAEMEPQEALRMVPDLSFGAVIGVNRAHHVGLNSFDDLLAGNVIPPDAISLIDSLISKPHELELFHQLIFSAIRRLKRNESALAVLDAQSSFESLVAVLVVESLQRKGEAPEKIETEMSPGGSLHTLQRRLEHLDRTATKDAADGEPSPRFLSSPEETQWRSKLYRLRNRIVHEGIRIIDFSEAKAALVAGLHAIYSIQSLSSDFQRTMIWSGAALDLVHIKKTAGRLSRLFEA